MKINKVFVFSRYIFTGLNFVAILLITSMLGIAEFGELSFFRLILQYLMYSEFGFVQYIFRKRSADGIIPNYELSSVFSYLAISVCSFLFVFAILDLEFDAFFSNPVYVLYATFSVIFGISAKFLIDEFRITGDITKLISLEFITNSTVYLVVLYCYISGSYNVDVFVALYALYMAPYFFLLIFSSRFRDKVNKINFNFKLDKKILYASSMLFLFGFLSLLLASVDRLIIKYFLNFEALGLYSMAFTVSSGFYMVIQTLTWVNMPSFINSIKNEVVSKSMKDFKEYIFKIQLIYLSVLSLALPCYYLLIRYYNREYEETFWIFVLLSLYNFINVYYIYHRTYLLVHEYYYLLNITLFIGVIFNFILNIYLVSFHVLELLVIGSIISHLLYMVIIRNIVIKKANK